MSRWSLSCSTQSAAVISLSLFFVVALLAPLGEAFAAEQVPGIFAQGRVRGSIFGGAGSVSGVHDSRTYLILGVGAGYYLIDGLEVGADLEGWLLESPQYYKVTPQVRYIFWQVPRLKPYAGVFWRRTFVTDSLPDYSSWGGRLGVAFQSKNGRSYIAVGAVYERFLDNDDVIFYENDNWYPEVAFWISF